MITAQQLELAKEVRCTPKGAEGILLAEGMLSGYKQNLVSQNLINPTTDLNLIYRVAARLDRILTSELNSLHLSLGILIKRQKDVLIDYESPFSQSETNAAIEIVVDWPGLLAKVFSEKARSTESSLEVLIPEIALNEPMISSDFLPEEKTSFNHFTAGVREFADGIERRADTKLRLLDLVRSGKGHVVGSMIGRHRASDDHITEMTKIDSFRKAACSEAPLWQEGSYRMLDAHLETRRRVGLGKDECAHTLEKGLDKEWFRERSALVTYLFEGLNSSWLISSWGLSNVMGFNNESSNDPITDAINNVIKMQEVQIETTRASLARNEAAIERHEDRAGPLVAPWSYRRLDIHSDIRAAKLLHGYKDLALEYFSDKFRQEL